MRLNKLFKALQNPAKAYRFLKFMFKHNYGKKKNVLFIIGLEEDGVFSLMYKGYQKCYCFEANPERFKQIHKRYSHFPHIELHNVAIADYNGEITFNISNNNNGASSSVGTFKEEWQEKYDDQPITMVKSITVPCINLYDFCIKNNINYIDDYLSDIQGMDLTVLKTMKPMIDSRSIGSITCEVTKDKYGNIYKNLAPNTESEFNKLLGNNYRLVAKGWGVLEDGRFEKNDEEMWEMDCKWVKKENP